jgi:hypothetical protein
MGGVNTWLSDQRYRLDPPPEDPDNPVWCAESQKLMSWGNRRIGVLETNPTDANLVRMTAALLDHYMAAVRGAEAEHRPEKNGGSHHCLHEALAILWDKIQEIKLDLEDPDLDPLEPRVIVVNAPDNQSEAPEPSVQEESGIEFGDLEDTEDTEGAEGDNQA